jgi:predicted nucleotidyltransferase
MMMNNEYAEPIGQHKTLNPRLWDGHQLKSSVRGALMRIAEDFLEFVDIPVEVMDIVLAGGNANINYTEHSDIDLHIIADYDQISCDREVAELFDTKRLLYKREHSIEVFGIPVELYIEDHRTPAVSASFSILKGGTVIITAS